MLTSLSEGCAMMRNPVSLICDEHAFEGHVVTRHTRLRRDSAKQTHTLQSDLSLTELNEQLGHAPARRT